MDRTELSAYRDPAAARAGGYVLVVAAVLVVIGLIFHPMPAQGFEERPSVLSDTPWWGVIHVSIAVGFVLCALGGLLVLVGGGPGRERWTRALFWGSICIGMVFFTGVALINGWVMHSIAPIAAQNQALYDAMNDLLIGYGWLGNPLFLFGLTGIAIEQLRYRDLALPGWVDWLAVVVTILSWGRGIGSATGLYFLEVLIYANVPAFIWFGYYGWSIAKAAKD